MEDGDARLGGEDCGVVRDAAVDQRGLDRGGEVLELDQLALSELGIGIDDAGADPSERMARDEQLGDGVESRDCRGQGIRVRRSGGDRLEPAVLQLLAAAEQHLAFVGEVAKERALGQPRGGGDLGDRRVLVSLLIKQGDRGRRQAASGIRLPPRHTS